MHDDICEYIKKSRNDRRTHLRLDEPCIEIGGCSSDTRGLLAFELKTTIPNGKKILICHACHNGKCSNVKHVYWGTAKDNYQDQVDNGTATSIYAKGVAKYGKKKWHVMMREHQVRANIKRAEHPRRTYEEYRNSFLIEKKRGWVTKLSSELKLSHTQVARINRWLQSHPAVSHRE